MTKIVGKDGKPIDISKAKLIGEEIYEYRIGEIQIQTNDKPEVVLQKAQEQAKGLLAQQGQYQAAAQANPFVFEPAALAVFMLLCDEVKRLDSELKKLKEDNDGE